MMRGSADPSVLPFKPSGRSADLQNMERLALVVSLVLLPLVSTWSTDLVMVGDEIMLPLPEGWHVLDSSSYPIAVRSSDGAAEVRVFRSVIDRGSRLTDPASFHAAVDSVVQSVIMRLPRAAIISNTGYQDSGRLSFALEFETDDEYGSERLRHRLKGILYDLPEGDQLLFTLWARAGLAQAAMYEDDWLEIQQGFAYGGPQVQSTLSGNPWWRSRIVWPALLIAALLVLMLVSKRPAGAAKPSYRG